MPQETSKRVQPNCPQCGRFMHLKRQVWRGIGDEPEYVEEEWRCPKVWKDYEYGWQHD